MPAMRRLFQNHTVRSLVMIYPKFLMSLFEHLFCISTLHTISSSLSFPGSINAEKSSLSQHSLCKMKRDSFSWGTPQPLLQPGLYLSCCLPGLHFLLHVSTVLANWLFGDGSVSCQLACRKGFSHLCLWPPLSAADYFFLCSISSLLCLEVASYFLSSAISPVPH